jgi:hypothetical protein
VNKDTVDGGIKAVKTRKARYALFKVVNEEGGALQITLDKQAERKASKEDFFKDLSANTTHCTIRDGQQCASVRVTDLTLLLRALPCAKSGPTPSPASPSMTMSSRLTMDARPARSISSIGK